VSRWRASWVLITVLVFFTGAVVGYQAGYGKAKRDMAMMVFKTLQQQFKRQ
jgi:ABC-type dipeptide/oligopeptide/nickel transport system permease subunit